MSLINTSIGFMVTSCKIDQIKSQKIFEYFYSLVDNWTTTDEPAETTTEETFSTETTKMTSAFNVATSNKATTIGILVQVIWYPMT